MKILIEKILARGWSRILFFIALWIAFGIAEYSFFYHYTPYLSLFAASIITEGLRRNSRWYALGLYPGRTLGREILWGLTAGIGASGLIFLCAMALGAPFRGSEEIFIQNLLWVSLRIFIFATGEEFMFRGMIFQTLSDRFGPVLSMLGFSLIFATAHSANPNASWTGIANVFLANVLMTLMYLGTESLWPSIMFHFSWNWMQFLFGLPISGIYFGKGFGELDLTKLHLNLQRLTGGLFGVEEGILTGIVLIALIIVMPKFMQISAFAAARKYRRNYAEAALRMKHLPHWTSKGIVHSNEN